MGAKGRAEKFEGLGVLDTAFPLSEVKQILGELGRESRRRRKLPADLMVYYSIALGLMCAVGARQVLRHLLDHLRENEAELGPLATEAAIRQGGRGLGAGPLRAPFGRAGRPM